jgi:hypothetical protein
VRFVLSILNFLMVDPAGHHHHHQITDESGTLRSHPVVVKRLNQNEEWGG